jgi:hypothetical protein
MSDLTLTRIFAAEHSYPTPTRNHLSMHNREASKRAMYRPTQAGKVRFGKRLPDGTTVMGPAPISQDAATRRREELANEAIERAERAKRITAMVTATQAESDSWAHKS